MIRTWMLALSLITLILAAPAQATAGCGACPTDKAKAASDQKACPVGCQMPCCNPDAEAGEHAHGHDHEHGEGHEGHAH